MKTAVIFSLAIVCEVIGTSALKFSDGFTKVVPSAVVAIAYGVSFYLLAISLKVIPIGVAYAIWSGAGIVLTVAIGMAVWHEPMDWGRGIGIALILAGVLIVNLFSQVAAH